MYFKNMYKYIAIILIVIILSVIFEVGSGFEKEITISKKYTMLNGVRYLTTRYMVTATDGSIYQVSNVWWLADFNNVEDWNNMDVGKTYRVKGWGYRIPLFNVFPNVYEIVSK